MVKRILFSCIVSSVLWLSAKAQNDFLYAHLLRTGNSFTTGYLFEPQSSPIYIQGVLEYYLDSRFSLRSDGYYFLNEVSNNFAFETNHQLFSGLSYHFLPDNKVDVYGSFQVGAAFTEGYNAPVLHIVEEPYPVYSFSVNPVYSIGGGVNFYAPKWFHVFLEMKYINGTYLSMAPSISLNELRFSFGLGFNLWLKKK